ncbi:MAG: site-2 protease family protein [Mycobacteriales bacterium]
MSNTGLGITLFALALLVSIMLHEAGHFLTARAFGMKASQFFVGFGPTLWSFRRGETEYGVKAIPAGGFVKIVGMTDVEEIDPEDEPRAFWRQPAWQRFTVLVAGSTVHMILAFLILVPTFALFDLGTGGVSTVVAAVSDCVPAVVTEECAPGDAAPAKNAGLLAGDTLVEFAGRPVADWTDDFAAPLRQSRGPVSVVVERNGQRVPLTITPVVVKRTDPEDPAKTVDVAQIGVAATRATADRNLPQAAGASIQMMGDGIWGSAKLLRSLPGAIWKTFIVTINGEDREITDNAPISVVGASRLGGQALEDSGVATFLILVAGINIVIGFLNLLPLLPMDGGHVAILLFEKARGFIYRRIGRRDPGRVDIMKLQPIALAVILFFGVMSLVLIYADVVNPIANPF